jgi:hypothetical protein
MDLIEKYLGEGMPYGNSPSLDSLKYKGPGSPRKKVKDIMSTVQDGAESSASIKWRKFYTDLVKKLKKERIPTLDLESLYKIAQTVKGFDADALEEIWSEI